MQDSKLKQSRILRKIFDKHKVLEKIVRPRVGDFFASELVRWLLLFNFILIVVPPIILWWNMRSIDYQVILQYNVFFGVDLDQMGDWHKVFKLSFLGVGIFVANSAISLFLYRKKERIAAYMMLFGSLAAQVGIGIFVTAIVLVN